MPITKYQWRPLDKARKEIRVLDLDPETGNAPLIGRLRHVFLDESQKPFYVTISYAWGDTALVDEISVNGKTIPIPASAGSALRCMRSPDETHTFWIDCICIDQNNDHEKGHQVGWMADIFRSSRGTLAYLGDDIDNTAAQAFSDLEAIASAFKESNDAKLDSNGTYGKLEDCGIQNWSSLRETIDLVAIKATMEKPYFNRLWVVQEAALSVKTMLCCGTRSIDLHVFIFAIDWLREGPSGFEVEIGKGHQLRNAASFLNITRLGLANKEMFLGRLLSFGIMLQCSEPRDRVYGFLGLLELSARKLPFLESLAPDYTKSVVNLYCDATRACIGECRPPWLLDAFGYEREKDNTIEGLPTWVPNWYCGSRVFDIPDLTLPRSADLWPQNNLHTDAPLVPESSVGRILSIRGVVLETISRYSNAFIAPDTCSHHEFIVNALELLSDKIMLAESMSIDFEKFVQIEHVLGAGEPDAKVLRRWLKLVASTLSEKDHDTDEMLRLTSEWNLPSILTQTDGSDSCPPEAQDAMREAFYELEEAMRFCNGRKAFSTQSGLLGLGPKVLQDGDVIAVSKLSQHSMVLRRAEAYGPDHYTVVGHAFVEGIHNGEEVFAAAAEGEGIGKIHLV